MGWEAHTVGGWHILGRQQVGEWRGWPGGWLDMREGCRWDEGGGWASWSGVGRCHCDGSVILNIKGGGGSMWRAAASGEANSGGM